MWLFSMARETLIAVSNLSQMKKVAESIFKKVQNNYLFNALFKLWNQNDI